MKIYWLDVAIPTCSFGISAVPCTVAISVSFSPSSQTPTKVMKTPPNMSQNDTSEEFDELFFSDDIINEFTSDKQV